MSGPTRQVQQVVKGVKITEGAGVRICRTIGTGPLRNLDPFLMLDELKLPADQATAGFPSHPHRGFETVSIMLSGRMEHKDSQGNQGVIGPGGVQWMTAGRGIIHSEMPVVTSGMLHGFQLWVNLPAKDKMVKPRYQDVQADEIPSVEGPGSSVRVMAGAVGDSTGPIKLRHPGTLLDVRLQPGAAWVQDVPGDFTTYAYVYEGSGKLGGTSAEEQHGYVFSTGDGQVEAAAGDAGLKFLLVAAKPFGEPIVQHGPFVMNTAEEIQQAFSDYQHGNFQSPDDNPWQDEL